jgi:dTDP-4-dehydrorhamnose reductase
MNVVVIGGSGLVGTNAVERFEARGHEVTGTYHTNQMSTTQVKLDKTDAEAVKACIFDHDADVVVDTAAFHAVDDCETDRTRAWNVNVQGTRNAVCAADAVEAHYIYVSTDYVFAGIPAEAPYDEEDPVNPLNYYAQVKYAGEQAAKIAEHHTIIRTSVVYGLASDNFLTWVLGELEAGNEVDIVDDQVSRPTYAPDLARACTDICEDGITGLYHATGPKSVSRYQFTTTLTESLDMDPSLVSAITTEELGQEAPRPADSSLDSSSLYDEIDAEFQSPSKAFADVRSRK